MKQTACSILVDFKRYLKILFNEMAWHAEAVCPRSDHTKNGIECLLQQGRSTGGKVIAISLHLGRYFGRSIARLHLPASLHSGRHESSTQATPLWLFRHDWLHEHGL